MRSISPTGNRRAVPTGPPITCASSAPASSWPDVVRWVKFSSLSWTEDGKGFFYGRYPEPRAGKALEDAVRDKKIYYHALGTQQSADRLIYERPDEPMLFIDAYTDETGRYLFFATNKGTSNKNELFVKDLGDPIAPKLDAPVRALYPGHTASYDPLGIVDGTMYLLTDRGAPNKKVVSVPIDRPDAANWKTVVAESRNTIASAGLIAGKLAVNALVDVASEVRFYDLDGSPAGQIATPDLGTDRLVWPAASTGRRFSTRSPRPSIRRPSFASTSATARARRSRRRS